MTKIINTALLAFGMSGKVFHAPFIHLHPGYKLVGAWERSKKEIEVAYPETKTYDSLDEVLNDKTVELVVVNTPVYTHFEYAKAALEAGKHILVEKAFTSTLEEAIELKKIAEKAGRKIAVFQNRRWDSDFLTVKKVIESKDLGELKDVEIHYDRFALDLSYKKHKEELNSGSGIVKDLGPHIIDQALVLFGMPTALFADIRTIRPTSLVEDYCDILLFYPKLNVRMRATLIAKESLPSYIVNGTNGSFLKSRADVQEAELQKGVSPDNPNWGTEPSGQQGLINYLEKGETIRKQIFSEKGNYMKFFEGVHQALTTDVPMPVTVDDGIRVMQIIDAAYTSLKEKRVITLKS